MCPSESPNLFEVWGKDFDDLYEKYEKEGRFRKQIPAQQLWTAIMEAQVPFLIRLSVSQWCLPWFAHR